MAKRLYFIPKSSYQGLIVEKTVNFPEVRGERAHSMKKTLDTMLHVIRAKESGGEILEV